jgi:predicted AAA+ superfamily ATPase
MGTVKRSALTQASRLTKKFPALAITGPRQSGKTTFARMLFPAKPYVSLENADIRAQALTDPRAFLQRYKKGAILDEVQRAPELFSYLQQILDETKAKGLFILTGSSQFLLQENISQTLAGRIAYIELLPFDYQEICRITNRQLPLNRVLLTGGYPAIYNRKLKPGEWFSNYIRTYIDRDVRQIKNIGKISAFNKFIKLCAARSGQLLNMSNLSVESGVDNKTVQSWLSVLQSSYVIHLLQPHHANFNKRLVKMPKLYFYDTGLLCAFLEITNEKMLELHPLRGNIFENYIINELIKERFNNGLRSNLFFWRDNKGTEIDVMAQEGNRLLATEIKSGITMQDGFFKNLVYWNKLSANKRGRLVYAGNEEYKYKGFDVVGWKSVTKG